jgi:subtilisin family serine protease
MRTNFHVPPRGAMLASCVRALAAGFAIVSIGVACSDSEKADTSQQPREVRRSLPENMVPGSYIITVTSGVPASAVDALAARTASTFGCTASKAAALDLFGIDGASASSSSATYNVKFEGCDSSRQGAIAILDKLAEENGVLVVKGEGIAALSDLVEPDPLKPTQSHLPFIRRDEACANAVKTGPRVVVGVIDTGVEVEHPDLKDILHRDATGAIVGANFLDGDGNNLPIASPPDNRFQDLEGHGSHVAGLVAETAGNAIGGVGVAACGNVAIMPVRVCGPKRCPALAIERGIAWAVQNGADVINLSLGGWEDVWGTSTLSDAAVDAARAKNVLVVASAGNDNRRLGTVLGTFTSWVFPAAYEHVVGVGATAVAGPLATFSNKGPRVRIAAPGVDLVSTFHGDYAPLSGTSMASPVVTGSYALGLAVARGRAGADPQQRLDVTRGQEIVVRSILATAPLPREDVEAGGVIDAKQLVDAMSEAAAAADPDAGVTPDGGVEAGPSLQNGSIWVSVGNIVEDQLGVPMIDPARPNDLPKGAALAFAGTELFVAATVQTNIPSRKLFVRRFDGTSWKRAGDTLSTSVASAGPSTLIDCPVMTTTKEGRPLLGFFVGTTGSCKYAVREYNSGTDSWAAVGPDDGLLSSAEDLCPFAAQTICEGRSALAVDGSGRAVVAFRSVENAAVVKRLEGGVWKPVGPGEGGIPSSVDYTGVDPKSLALTIGLDGAPILATVENALHVRRFDATGGVWSGVGPNDGVIPSASIQLLASLNLAVQPSGPLLLAQSATPFSLRRFDGNAWGAQGLDEAGGWHSVRMALDSAGNPVVTFAPKDSSRNTAVVRQESTGSPWTPLGPAFTASLSEAPGAKGLAYDTAGKVFFLLEDSVYRLD